MVENGMNGTEENAGDAPVRSLSDLLGEDESFAEMDINEDGSYEKNNGDGNEKTNAKDALSEVLGALKRQHSGGTRDGSESTGDNDDFEITEINYAQEDDSLSLGDLDILDLDAVRFKFA